MRTALALFVVAISSSVCLAETNVPAFLTSREPVAADAATPPERWSATENVRWKVDVPGLAWSSPIVWGDRVYLTTCITLGENREPKKGLYLEELDANKYPVDKSIHEWKLLCYDLNSGSLLWEKLCHSGVPAKPHHIKNTLASETPTTDGERIYAYFGNLGLYCFTMDGEPVWSRPFEAHETNYGWGTSISPVVYQGRVYIVDDNEESSSMLALDAKTGKEIWSIPREEKTNYSTPFIWETPERTEIVVSSIGYARSYDLDGKLLWQIKGRSILAIPTPFERFGNLYLTSGHVAWGENPMYVIKPGAEGDLSPSDEKGAALSPHLAWYQPKAGPYHPTPLIIGEQIYVLYDRGLMASFNAKTGEPVYPRKRIPDGRAFTSSPWTYGDKLFCVNEDGVTFVIKPGPEFEVLYTNSLLEDDMCMATPVIVGDKLLIRSSARLYCIAAGAAPTAVGSK